MKIVSWLDKFAEDRSKLNKMKKTAEKIIVDKENFPTVENDEVVEYENEKYKVVDSKFNDEKGEGVVLEKCAELTGDPTEVEMGTAVDFETTTEPTAQEYACVDPEIQDEDPRDAEVEKFEEEAINTEVAIETENAIDGTKGDTRPNRIIQKMFDTLNVTEVVVESEPSVEETTEVVEPTIEETVEDVTDDDMIDLETYEFDEEVVEVEDDEAVVEAEIETEADTMECNECKCNEEKNCEDIKALENEFKRCSNRIFNKLNK